MVSKKTRRNGNGVTEGGNENDEGGVAEYEQSREQSREQRIKENLQRMQKLGILDLSRNLKPPSKPKAKTIRPQKPELPSSGSPPRRSSRIKTIPAVSYSEKRIPNDKIIKNVKIVIAEGSKPEVYTEEHEKMLGDHKETWELCVDGYDVERNRIYDGYGGKSCHQCRQKTIGHRTRCCKCTSVSGQFCGDCLFMRYGENVLEANANPDWVCPVCRDICNCSRCRRVKGWNPTGNLYRKTVNLGFKSVAHYLIHTRGPHGKQEDVDSKHVSSEKIIKNDDDDDDDDGDGEGDDADSSEDV